MEEHLKNSPQTEPTVDGMEVKYISGLSTIMVATIQEAKDRISQIEYIFCSQLFPTFQSNSKSLLKGYSEARKIAEDAWKETEKGLLREIEELKLQNQQIMSENEALRLDRAKQSQELKLSMSLPLKVRTQQEQIDALRFELAQKSKEADDGLKLHNTLLQSIQAKTLDSVNKEKQLREHEEEMNMLLAQVKNLDKKVEFLQEELSRKTLVTENLLKKLETLSNETTDREHKLSCLEEEKRRLSTRLQIFEENVTRLDELLRQKTLELKDARRIQEGFREKLELTQTEMLEKEQQLADHEKEQKLLLMKVRSLEKEVSNMHIQLGEGGCKSVKEEKSSELAMERNRRKEVIEAYKKLKSQYNFLCKRLGLTESTFHQVRVEESKQPEQSGGLAIALALERKKSDASDATCGAGKGRIDYGSNGIREKENNIKNGQPCSSSSPSPPVTAGLPVSGSKRPASCWRDTRSRQSPGGMDPHDDFLDTPLESIKKDMNRAGREENHDIVDGKREDSDKETQDMSPNPIPTKQQRIQVVGTNTRAFKYVEPVRKKSEREKLKGVECKQCKKFYDAVLPGNGGEGSDGNKKSFRCEHEEGVSRHRYKYAPPMTPEGFWNIGFESEM